MSTPPKGSSKSQPAKSPSIDPLIGSFVQYDDEGSVLLGVVTGLKKDRYTVFNIRGREIELGRGRLYELPGRETSGGTNTARSAELAALDAKISNNAASFDVAELWSFVVEEQRTYSVQELCEAYLGNNAIDQHAGLRVALIQERLHFKRDRDSFEPRSAEIVEDLKKAEEAKRKKAAVRDATVQFLMQRVKDRSAAIPREVEENLELLGEVAAIVPHSDSARQKEGKQLVHLCAEALRIPESMPLEKQAFEALLRVGVFHRDTNLAFIRNAIPVAHDLSTSTEAHDIPDISEIGDLPDHERSGRVDLTSRRSVTIDDQSTKDMDDALSLEQTRDGYELGIHITDVTWAVLPETHLDRSARRRATSLYCADQTVNMLPEIVAQDRLSLRAGVVRPCISVLVDLSSSYQIESWRVVASFVRVTERYSYDQVDHLLEEGDPTLLAFHEIAAACEEERIRRGAVKVHRREVVPFLEPDASIRLLEIDEDSPARALVAEMMVLANSCMAQYAAEHNIPVLFRGQERFDEQSNQGNAPSNGTPEGPAKDYEARTKLKKSTVSLDPRHHASLGLDAYIQASSPIRRYMDLCHQRQFISHLRTSRPWLTREQFEQLAFEVEEQLQSANVASRETKRYWLLRYLEQRDKGTPIQGTVVRVDLKSPLVELDEVYITVFARTAKPVQPGDRLSLKISTVDPRSDYIRVEEQ